MQLIMGHCELKGHEEKDTSNILFNIKSRFATKKSWVYHG